MRTLDPSGTLELVTHMSMPIDPSVERLVNVGLSQITSKISLQETLSRMPSDNFREQALQANKASLTDFLDDWCGTKPRHPWKPPVIKLPHVGPFPPHVAFLALKLNEQAELLSEGVVKTEMKRVASELMQRALAFKDQPDV